MVPLYTGSKDVSASSEASDSLLARAVGRLYDRKKQKQTIKTVTILNTTKTNYNTKPHYNIQVF